MRLTTPFAFVAALALAFSAARAEGPPALARYIPRDDLVGYAEFDGLDAHADAWKRTAAAQILGDTTTGAMLEAILVQVADRALPEASGGKLSGDEFRILVEHGLRSGFALAINKAPGARKPSCVALVLRGAARGEVRPILDRMLAAASEGSTVRVEPAAGGRSLHVVKAPKGTGWAWWVQGEDLAFSLVAAEGATAMIEAFDGRKPDAQGHPTRAALAAVEDGFTPIGLGFFDASALPPLPPKAILLGMAGVRRLEFRWGLQDDALMTVTRLVAPAPRAGILALFDQPTFDADTLPPIPAGQVGLLAFSSDLVKLRDTAVTIAETTNADGGAGLKSALDALDRAIGHPLRDDLLKHLGPKMAVYVVPERITAPTNPLTGFAQGMLRVTKGAWIAEVDDSEAVGAVLDDLIKQAEATLKARPDAPKALPDFRAVKGPDRGYELRLPPGTSPLPAGMAPTIVVGRKYAVIGTTPAAARAALAAAAQPAAKPAGGSALAVAMARLPKGLTFLSVSDARESILPEVVANLPALIQMTNPGGSPIPFPGSSFIGRNRVVPAFPLNIDPDLLPPAEAIREHLFPATYALAVDKAGLQFVSREAFPSLNPTTLAPVALAVLLPAVEASRAAARRSQSINNLKQMGLALHNLHSTENHFPPRASRDQDGKPLLSWRVAILPFIEQNALFQEFKQDEPWDSPHNQALLERMPAVYAVPGASAKPGETFYQGFAGKGTFFDPEVKEGVTLAEITDGTSNTIAVVEARKAVPWTKPDDVEFDPEAKPEGGDDPLLGRLGGHFAGGFNALFADGSVRFLRLSISPQVLRALITRNGGEVVSSDSF